MIKIYLIDKSDDLTFVCSLSKSKAMALYHVWLKKHVNREASFQTIEYFEEKTSENNRLSFHEDYKSTIEEWLIAQKKMKINKKVNKIVDKLLE